MVEAVCTAREGAAQSQVHGLKQLKVTQVIIHDNMYVVHVRRGHAGAGELSAARSCDPVRRLLLLR